MKAAGKMTTYKMTARVIATYRHVGGQDPFFLLRDYLGLVPHAPVCSGRACPCRGILCRDIIPSRYPHQGIVPPHLPYTTCGNRSWAAATASAGYS